MSSFILSILIALMLFSCEAKKHRCGRDGGVARCAGRAYQEIKKEFEKGRQ